MFVFEFEAALLTLNVKSPSRAPLFQLPPREKAYSRNPLYHRELSSSGAKRRFQPPINRPNSTVRSAICSC